MAASAISILTLGVTATAALTADRAVTHAGAVPAAGANILGIGKVNVASGDRQTVDVMGTTIAEAGAAIAANALLEVDASGRVITKNTGATIGRLAPGQTAGAAGDKVEIILFPN